MAEVLLIDNYDSFTWNLYQYLSLQEECGSITVVRSGDVDLATVLASYPKTSHLVISPGPGHPLSDSGISIDAIKHYAGKLPILGVCMGLQCIFAAYGGTVERVGEIVHGKTSVLKHDGRGLFKGVKADINGTRYHSLAGMLGTLPADLEVTCRTPRLGQSAQEAETDGIVMGVRHREYTVESVQYHPESILSEAGREMLRNFLTIKGGRWEDNPGYGLTASERASSSSTSKNAANANGVDSGKSKSKSNGSAPTILDRIYAQRRLDVEKAKATPGTYPSDLSAFLNLHLGPPQISFYDRLLPSAAGSLSAGASVALMAEMKRASPSKGDILPADSPLTSASIGLSYAQAGAAVISVLTEPTWFKGQLNDMLAVRRVVEHLPHRPAILRKDFIFDTYQIDEARYYGADTVLLIVAMLSDDELQRLYEYARFTRGMEPLVEVNNADELKRALRVGAKVIGVNNRNLHDFQVDMGTTSRIAEVIEQQQQDQLREQANGAQTDTRKVILAALSGITGREDVVRYQKEGVGAALVGESLMRADDKGKFVRTLLGTSSPEAKASALSLSSSSSSLSSAARRPSLTSPPDGFATEDSYASKPRLDSPSTANGSTTRYAPLVKICGIKTPEAALAAAEAGADFLGLIFVPKSKRYVTLAEAKAIVDAVRTRQGGEGAPAAQSVSQAKGKAAVSETATDLDGTADFFALQAKRLALPLSTGGPRIVGVFQDQSLGTVLETLEYLKLDIVQLHGSEPAEWSRILGVPTFRAFHVDEAYADFSSASPSPLSSSSSSSSVTAHALREAQRPGYHSIPLLDTKVAGSAVSGGAGKTFDWSLALRLVQDSRLPLVLAGGLEVGNVGNAVRLVQPWALDVSGGVETDGKKDLDKVRQFVRAAKGAADVA